MSEDVVDPLGLDEEVSTDTLLDKVRMFDTLNREMDDMARTIDEDIVVCEVEIMKLKEKRAELCGHIMDAIAALEADIRETVLEVKKDGAAGVWTFGYSETLRADVKAMKRDVEKYPILKEYYKKSPTVSKRRKG